MADDQVWDDLIARWFEYQRRASGTREERKALSMGEPAEVQYAHDWVAAQIDAGGPRAVDVVAALSEAAPPDDDGVTVGVGPIEDLLQLHGHDLADMLVARARRTPALSRALAHTDVPDGSVSAPSLAALAQFRT